MPRTRTTRRPQTRADYQALAALLRPKDWSRAGLRARCAHQALALLARDVPAAVVTAWWPGGAENGDDGSIGPFVRCYAELAHRLRASEPARAAVADATLQQAILDGITDQPAPVRCVDGETRGVYAKALPVHFALSALDAAVADPATPPARAALHIQQWAWIVTTPGACAPFDVRLPLGGWPAPPTPSWLDTLHEYDVLALVQAYNAIDRAPVRAMLEAFPRQRGAPSRLALAGFFGVLAKDRDVQTLSAKHVIATTLSEVRSHEEARQRAESEAAARPAGGA